MSESLMNKQQPMRAGFVVFALFLASTFIAGCGATTTITRDTVQFKGDVSPRVTSAQFLAGDLSNLSEGEALIFAQARDGSGAVSYPGYAELVIAETILANDRREGQLGLDRCDLDGDGILDGYCPDLALLTDEKYVNFQSLYAVSRDAGRNRDHWGDSDTVVITDEADAEIPVFLKILSINRGNKTFEGDFFVYVDIPPQVTFAQVLAVNHVVDQRETVTALSMIPFIGLVTLGMRDYGRVNPVTDFEVLRLHDHRIKIIARNVTLPPGQGIDIEYEVAYRVTWS